MTRARGSELEDNDDQENVAAAERERARQLQEERLREEAAEKRRAVARWRAEKAAAERDAERDRRRREKEEREERAKEQRRRRAIKDRLNDFKEERAALRERQQRAQQVLRNAAGGGLGGGDRQHRPRKADLDALHERDMQRIRQRKHKARAKAEAGEARKRRQAAMAERARPKGVARGESAVALTVGQMRSRERERDGERDGERERERETALCPPSLTPSPTTDSSRLLRHTGASKRKKIAGDDLDERDARRALASAHEERVASTAGYEAARRRGVGGYMSVRATGRAKSSWRAGVN